MKKSLKILIGVGVLLLAAVIISFTPPGMETHENSRLIKAPKEVVWKVISDVSNYHRYATGLSNVTIVSGSGVGMIRSCSDEQGVWMETCTAWSEGNSYSFNVDVGSGFPYPFKVMEGTWSVESIDDSSSTIEIVFNYQFPYRWMKWMFNDATHEAFDGGDTTLLDNWESAINTSYNNLDTLSNDDPQASSIN